MRSDQSWFTDMLAATNAILNLTDELNYESFLQSRRDQSSLLFELAIIGEAAAHLSDDLRKQHPTVEWHLMTGARNVIVHGYFGLEWSRLWMTPTVDIPILR